MAKCSTLTSLLGLVAFFLSCSDPNEDRIKANSYSLNDFPKKELLKGKKIQLDSSFNPTKIKIIGDKNLLLVVDKYSQYFIKIYTLDSFKFLKSFGKKGSGNEEFIGIGSIAYDIKKQLLYISDGYKSNLHIYSINSLLKSKSQKISPLKVIQIQHPITSTLVLPNNNIVSTRINLKKDSIGMFNLYDNMGSYIKYVAQYPFNGEDYPSLALYDVYSGKFAISPSSDKILYAYNNTDILDMYNLNFELKKRIQGPMGFRTNLEVEKIHGAVSVGSTTKSKVAFRGSPRFTDSGVYILFDGETAKRKGYQTKKLLKYSSNLDLLTYYNLDKEIFDFDIDLNGKIIYGLSHESKQNLIIFKL
jgi:hypothetical protein